MTMDRNGEVITFFSFKGGTGRTMALANVAWILASQGKRVLVVDWDLDSPGLDKFFHPFLDRDLYDATSGVVEIISEYVRASTQSGEERPEGWLQDYARVLPYAVSLNWDFPGDGTLDIISAGRPGAGYSEAFSGIDWANFAGRMRGGLFFDAMRQDMKRTYDYTLIDSRTGLSDMAGICTMRFPDTVVNCFTLSDQSIEGAARVATGIHDLVNDIGERQIRILPVPMRVEDAEQAKLENGRALARSRFADHPMGFDADQRQRYWREVEIPYKPFYAYEEVLATFGDEPRSPLSLLSAYERLTTVVSGGEVRELAPMPEETRRRWAAAFERRSIAPPPDVFLSYAPEDRMWADWVAGVLHRRGARVVIQGVDFRPGVDIGEEVSRTVGSAGATLVLLSTAYVRSTQAQAVWEVLAAAESGGPRKPVIPVLVGDVRLAPPFDTWTAVDLARLDEHSASEAVLRSLDLDKVVQPPETSIDSLPRFPSTRPPVWSVPPRNASFTGRAGLLEKLRDNLSAGVTVVLPQAVHGLGGVGKTQLALEYAHRFMADYDLVWWISAQQEELIAASLAEIAPRLNIRRYDNIDEAADAVREALRRGEPYRRWLLVFDNAEDPEKLAPHLPQGPGHVIITSRDSSWSHLATPLEVDTFTRDESIEHLTRRVPALSRDEASQVALILGDLPLAIELASAWLESTGMPVGEYVELLRTQLATWLDSDRPGDYPVTAAATWRVSIERLRVDWPAAVRLLELCSCFGPDPISMSVVYSDETFAQLLPFDPALQEKMVLGRVIREIGRYALARIDQGRSIQVHRLVQAVVRDSLSEEQLDRTLHDVHRILVSARPRQGDVDNPENWPRYNEIWPHLGPSRARECAEELVLGLLVERVRYMWRRGEYDDALNYAQSLEQQWLDSRGPDDRQLLYLRFHIANLYRSQGEYQKALEINEDVYARQVAAFGKDYIHALMTANGLTADHGATGHFDRALTIARETAESFTELYGEDYPQALMAANNLAMCLRLVGDFVEARQIDGKTLALRRVVLGDSHPLTLWSAASLARDLREAGEFEESVALLRTTLDGYGNSPSLGEDFPDAMRTAASLAVALRRWGRAEEAREASSRLLAQYESSYADNHPDLLACRLNLAADLSAVGDSAAALRLCEVTTRAYADQFGPAHQYTLVSANNQSGYLRDVGRMREGLEIVEPTYEKMCETLGPEHPQTLCCAMNLAGARADTGDITGAEALERQTLAVLRRNLGPNHPDTLFCACNLAVSLHSLTRAKEAQDLMNDAIARLERVLGKDHPELDRPRRWRRINRDLEPQPV